MTAVCSSAGGKLAKLLDDGDIDETSQQRFFGSARKFHMKATSEALAKLPLKDELLVKCRFVDFNFRSQDNSDFGMVEYFTTRYSLNLGQLTPVELDKLHEEFTEHQLLDEDIPNAVWEKASVRVTQEDEGDEFKTHRVDVIWGYFGICKTSDGRLRFGKLAKIAELVLVIPQSNTSEERVFSRMRKNKTQFRPSLAVNGTLSSLITMKLANPETVQPRHEYEPTKEVVRKAKSATKEYNRLH